MRSEKQGFDKLSPIGVSLLADKKMFFENRIAQEWLTTESAAKYLGISENALRIMVYRNQLRSHKLGRRLRFHADDLKALFIQKRV